MSGSTFGKLFTVTTWGESHGPALGAVIDGCPAGLPLSGADIQPWLDRRRPGQSRFTTARAESDRVQILSGIFEEQTTGTPISLLIENRDQRSKDYGNLASCYRPGHADYTYDRKYGIRDYRGGGRSSGRETAARVAAGAVAAKVLSSLGIKTLAYTSRIGDVICSREGAKPEYITDSPLYMPDPLAEQRALALLDQCIREETSVGGSIECIVTGLPSGIGEPVFDKLDAQLGKALFSIGAVKAVEIGDGMIASRSYGHDFNDSFSPDRVDGQLPANSAKVSSTDADKNLICDEEQYILPGTSHTHAGGILGGISDGNNLLIRAHFKPTPSISRPQTALTKDGQLTQLSIHGRHDPVIVPRAVVVVESMTALVVLDLLMQSMVSRMDYLQRFM